MGKRKVPPSSKKSLERVIAPATARRDDDALDSGETPAPAPAPDAEPADAPTGPVHAVDTDPPPVDVASEMTMPMTADTPVPDAIPEPIADEDPEALLSPDQIDRGDAESTAPPPRRAPSGDCRSLQRLRPGAPALFALVYRHGSSLVMRSGTIGRQGQWRVVDYPTPAAASRAYAREVGVFVEDGYTDVR